MFLSINGDNKPPSVEEINELTEAVGWGKRDPAKWERILEVSSYFAYCRDANSKLVAIGRVLEDGVMCMMYDICVHPNQQGQGLGSKVMNKLVDMVKDRGYVSIGLYVWDKNIGAVEFYEKFGFEKVDTGMELKKYMVTE
jgi:ribosomal protein S18 acetylase RimI-like enzyme